MIHFWLHNPPPAQELRDWSPDREPQRYASGVGHNLLELYKRLEAEGVDVSIGSEVPRGVQLLVVFLKSAFEKLPPRRRALRDALRAVQQVSGRFVLIRSDALPAWQLPVRPLVEFVPTEAMITHPWQRWLPPLPQRGLIPRRPERYGRIRSLAWKGNPPSVHPDLLSPRWQEALAARGVHWWLDMPGHTDGPDQAWHDFSEVDAVLCVRNPEHSGRWGASKPPTRVINAWVAGSVPFADREPGYLERASDGEDVLFVDSPWDCLGLIDRLNGDPHALVAMEQRCRARAEEFSVENVVARWREALLAASEQARTGFVHRALRRAQAMRHRSTLVAGLAVEPVWTGARRAAVRSRAAIGRTIKRA